MKKKDTRKPETIIRELRSRLNAMYDAKNECLLKLNAEVRRREQAERERDILRRALAVLEKSVGIEPGGGT